LYALGSGTGCSVAGKIEITPLVMPLQISHFIFQVLWWVIFKAFFFFLLAIVSLPLYIAYGHFVISDLRKMMMFHLLSL
jgi:hypothetical protein